MKEFYGHLENSKEEIWVCNDKPPYFDLKGEIRLNGK